MGDPVTLGLMASSGFSALSSINEGIQAKKFSKYQAKQSKADANAALGAAYVEANKIRGAAGVAQSQAVAATASSGVVVGDGSASLIEQSIRQRGEEDALMTIYDGQDTRRRGYAQASVYKMQGEDAFNKGIRNSFGSLIMAGGAGAGLIANWFKSDEGNELPSWAKIGSLKGYDAATGTYNASLGSAGANSLISSVSGSAGSGTTGGGK